MTADRIGAKERIKASSDAKNRPLLNRALNEYYLPGSTFKAVAAAAAIEARKDNLEFSSVAAGWTPPNSGRPIRDDEGEAQPPLGRRAGDALA